MATAAVIGAIAAGVGAAASIATTGISMAQAANARDAEKAAIREQKAQRLRDSIRDARRLAGHSLAQQGKSGILPTGSFMDVLGAQEVQEMENLERIRTGFGYREQQVDADYNIAQAAGVSSILGQATFGIETGAELYEELT